MVCPLLRLHARGEDTRPGPRGYSVDPANADTRLRRNLHEDAAWRPNSVGRETSMPVAYRRLNPSPKSGKTRGYVRRIARRRSSPSVRLRVLGNEPRGWAGQATKKIPGLLPEARVTKLTYGSRPSLR